MHPAAIVIVWDEAFERILLVKRRDVPLFVLPGGGIEEGESPAEAAVREVYEETGLSILVKKKYAEYYPINRLATRTHLFMGLIVSGTLRDSAETTAVAFYPIRSLPKSLFFLHRLWIEEALLDRGFLIKPIREVTYWSVACFFLRHPWIFLRYVWTRVRSGMGWNA